MATYTQNLPNNLGVIANRTLNIDTISRGRVKPVYLEGDATDTYTCASHETITYVKFTGNAAIDVKCKLWDMEGNLIDLSTTGVEDADSIQGPFSKAEVITDDEIMIAYVNGGISK